MFGFRPFSSSEHAGYRFGFNGMEKDDEVKGGGNSLDFGSRIYDPRLGRWLTTDPQAGKYPYISPYASFGDNPIYFVDPGGETLKVAGDLKQAEADMQSVVPTQYKGLISVSNDEIVFNITEKEAISSHDPGVMAVYRLVNSDKVYLWNTPPGSGNMQGRSKSGDRWKDDYVRDNSGQVVMAKQLVRTKANGKSVFRNRPLELTRSMQEQPTDPSVDYEREYPVGSSTGSMTRTEISMHEVLELYFEGEKGLPYTTHPDLSVGVGEVGSGAHNSAINVSEDLPAGDVRKGTSNGSVRIENEPKGPRRNKVE